MALPKATYVSLDDRRIRLAAEADPHGFVARSSKPGLMNAGAWRHMDACRCPEAILDSDMDATERLLNFYAVAEQGVGVVVQLFLHRWVDRCQHVGDITAGGTRTEQVVALIAAVRDLGTDRFGDLEWVV